jgi:hypothetical protein
MHCRNGGPAIFIFTFFQGGVYTIPRIMAQLKAYIHVAAIKCSNHECITLL